MLNYEFPPIGGGAAHAHLCLLKEYAGNSELTIDVLTSAPEPGFYKQDFSENITIYKVGLHKKSLHFWRKVEVIEWLVKTGSHYRKLLRENHYDLAHAFFGFPTGWLCYRGAEELPYIISLRGSDVPGYNIRLGLDYKLLGGLFRRIWSGASAIVANSKGLRDLALDFMPALEIKVIPNGIDIEQFKSPAERIVGRPIRLLTVCRLISRKRIDLLIEAAARAKELNLDIQLNVAGEGNLMEPLRRLAGELKLADNVTFIGRVPAEQMPQIYRDNDIFVMSSMHEGMSNAMLEAMASGLPIITTPCEGVEELVGDNGIVVQEAQAKAIAEAVRRLADDREGYKKMSACARERAGRFSWKSVAESYLSIYGTILNTPPKRP